MNQLCAFEKDEGTGFGHPARPEGMEGDTGREANAGSGRKVPGKVKGIAIVSAMKFVKKKFGVQAMQKVISATPEVSQVYLRTITNSNWYPFHVFLDLLRAIQVVIGKGPDDMEILRESGRYSSTEGLMWLYWLFYKINDPFSLAEKYAILWSSYYDTGVMMLLEMNRDDLMVRLLLTDFPVTDKRFYERLSGWIEGAVETAGGKEPRVLYSLDIVNGMARCEIIIVMKG